MVDVKDLVLGELVRVVSSRLGIVIIAAVVAVLVLAILSPCLVTGLLLRRLRLLLLRLLQLLPPKGLLVLLA